MTLETLKSQGKRVIGAKQTLKAVEKGLARQVFLAQDADARVTTPIRDLCLQKGVQVVTVPTMIEIGKACGIEVGAAAAAGLA